MSSSKVSAATGIKIEGIREMVGPYNHASACNRGIIIRWAWLHLNVKLLCVSWYSKLEWGLTCNKNRNKVIHAVH